MAAIHAWIHLLKVKFIDDRSLTLQEDRILRKGVADGVMSYLSGTVLGGALGYAVTYKEMGSFRTTFNGPFLPFLIRAIMMTAPAAYLGLYALETSQRPIVKEILELDGSQLKKEIVPIVEKDATLMRLVSGHFYKENASHAEYGDSPHGHRSHAVSRVTSNSNEKKSSVQSKRLPIGNSSDGMDNPMDPSFGHTTLVETQLPSVTTRNHERSHSGLKESILRICDPTKLFPNLVIMFQLRKSLGKGSLTPQEEHVLEEDHVIGTLSCWGGCALGGAVAVLGFRRLGKIFGAPIRDGIMHFILPGAIFGTGTYTWDRSQRFCLEEILALDGSQLQRELAAIIIQKHSNNTSMMRLVSRHFHVEEVFDDSRSDSTVWKWSYRNSFLDHEYADSPRGHGPLTKPRGETQTKMARVDWKDSLVETFFPFKKRTKMAAHDAMRHLKLKFSFDNRSLTPQEYQILQKADKQGSMSLSFCSALGGALAYAGTMWMGSFRSLYRLQSPLLFATRATIMLVAIRFAGEYARERSQEPIVLEILALDGGQLQKALVTIITEELGRSSSFMQLVSRHFYQEPVTIDSSSDSTIAKWWFRNDFKDYVLYGVNLQDHVSHPEVSEIGSSRGDSSNWNSDHP